MADNQICCDYVLAKFNGATLENDLIAELAPLIDFHQQHFTDSEACWLGRYLWPYWRT